ncbi:MAG TPA: hypothetical protein DD729_09320 [Rhodobacteraceae bacterium]|nr:hypothetical protein [Paracoccaceae bacterium]
MSETIDYGNLMHRAMRRLIREVLEQIAKDGLPGQHHFFISFDTNHPDVEIADWLSDRYPDEMTIVVQHWFDNLNITDLGFAITLNFGDNPEPLYIPYDAILTFVDPSVEFGLRFDTKEESEEERASIPGAALIKTKPKDAGEAPMHENATDDENPKAAEIVSLDSFRKP